MPIPNTNSWPIPSFWKCSQGLTDKTIIVKKDQVPWITLVKKLLKNVAQKYYATLNVRAIGQLDLARFTLH